MTAADLNGKKVTVMGIGLHGGAVEMIKWLAKNGAKVIATDLKDKDELAPSLEKLKGIKNVTLVTGQHRMEDFERVDMVFKNPAVRWDNKYVQAAVAKKIPIEMDASLFFKLCPSKKIIGVTGTKGKTTTASLIFEFLKSAGRKVVKVGIGQIAVMDKLTTIDKDTWVVFELSSWRLSALGRGKISPTIAVITNIFPDHLNYYKTMEEYIHDKRYIFIHQKKEDTLVINADNQLSERLASEAKGKTIFFSVNESLADSETSMDRVFVEDGSIGYKINGQTGQIGPVGKIKLPGQHNVGNVLAACSAALAAGVKESAIMAAVEKFQGNPHRLELVRELAGVKFINDTAATTPEAAMAAIEAIDEPINLIAGGSNKNLPLGQLAEKLANDVRVKRIFLLEGAATEELKDLIKKQHGEGKIEGIFQSIDLAIKAALGLADQGEVVMLSPGCASFGMFKNEFDRGDSFKAVVNGLPGK